MKSINKIIVVPDSFKGGITSENFCEIAKTSISKIYPEAQVLAFSVADGGEGTVHALLSSLGGERITAVVKNPFFEDMESFYGMLPNKTAVIEMAACAGLPLAKGRLNPSVTSTYGVGQLINDAAKHGCDPSEGGLCDKGI